MLKVKVQANGTVQLVHTDGDIELIAADDQHGFSNFIRKQILNRTGFGGGHFV